MQKAASAAKRSKSEAQVLDQGIAQLLNAVKIHAKTKGKPIKRDQLLKEGYSERFVTRVEQA